MLMAVEHAPPGARLLRQLAADRRAGRLLLSTGVFAVFSRLPEAQFLSWGWRVPFSLSALLVDRRIDDPAADSRDAGVHPIKEEAREARSRSSKSSDASPKQVLLAMGARFAENGAFYIYSVFVLTRRSR